MDKDNSIVAQVAAKVAGSVCCGGSDIDAYLAVVEAVHNDLMERTGVGMVAAAFPGATVEAAPAPAAAPGPTQQSVT
ncbi:uncharacterized protein METZ01_LOCUS276308, partial [marine metagenome]